MLLFVKDIDYGNLVIPLARVFEIFSQGKSVIITYDSGELVEVEGNFEKQLKLVSVPFASAEDVNVVFRQFYKAVNAGAKAFYFG